MKVLQEIELYFTGRVNELKQLARARNHKNPFVFLCCAAFLDYLVRMVKNKETGQADYKDFIRIWLSRVDVRYQTFNYIKKYKDSRQGDLPTQMYHILRCGLVHSFSFTPDSQSGAKGGRGRSIVISHDRNNGQHLTSYSFGKAPDACIFIAQDLTEDISKLVKIIFIDARIDKNLRKNIIQWFKKHPPIAGMNVRK